MGYGAIKLQNRGRRKLKAKQEAETHGKNYDKLCKYLMIGNFFAVTFNYLFYYG